LSEGRERVVVSHQQLEFTFCILMLTVAPPPTLHCPPLLIIDSASTSSMQPAPMTRQELM